VQLAAFRHKHRGALASISTAVSQRHLAVSVGRRCIHKLIGSGQELADDAPLGPTPDQVVAYNSNPGMLLDLWFRNH
jgi:hypothetical protein